MHVVLGILLLQQFTSHKSFTECFAEKKKKDISITMRCMIHLTEERARTLGMLQQGAGIQQISHLSQEGLQISISCWQMLQFTTNNNEFVIFRSPAFNGGTNASRRATWAIRIPVPHCSIPTALALSSVVVRLLIMEILSVFLFSETFSNWFVR